MATDREHKEIEGLRAEVAALRRQIERFREREIDLEESRRAMLYMLEDLNESSADIDRARKEWETTFDGISGPLYLHDSGLKVLRANKAYIREAGVSLEELVGRPYYGLFPVMETPFRSCREAMETGCERSEEVSTESGRVFDIHCYPIRDDTGAYLFSVHIMEEITERKKTEEDRAKLEEQLRQAQKMEAIGQLAGGVAHDFNNILNVIIGYGSIVLERLGPDDPSREHLNEVLSAADRAASLTRRLLAFSRKQVTTLKPVFVSEIISGLQKMLSRIIGEDIDLVTELSGGKMPVMADAGQIEQVLMNLAANARDAMPGGGRLIIRTEIAVLDNEFVSAYGYGKPGTYALISVSDTGTGMDEETQKKIFEPFFTTKGIGEGTGLGLSIVYGIIKQHEGFVKVYSEVGKGAIFRIYLPLLEGVEEIIREPGETEVLKGGSETILVAEDDASLGRLTRIILESFGYTVVVAADGEDAVEQFRRYADAIQLLICDIIMPRKGGMEVYEEIRKMNPEVKVLFASGYINNVIDRKGLRDRGLEIMTKPVSPKDLLRKVREVLDR